MTISRVYIVSVWCSGPGRPDFRASVRAVEHSEAAFFTTADDLASYLAKEAATDGKADPVNAAKDANPST